MRNYRAAAVALAALALTIVSACKDTTTSSGLGTVSCASGDAFLCPPNTLDLGFNGSSGTPTITPGTAGTSITSTTSAYVVTGTTTSTLPGYWLLVQDGTLNTWGVLAVSGSTYLAEVPLFCGAQYLILKFTASAGSSYYMVNVTRTGCTGHAAFRVQLTWGSDAYSDLDLHLLRPAGTMNSTNDCYYWNCTGSGLTWGSSNPVLDVDDVNGYGPENIYLTSSAESGDYRIIVNDYDNTVGEIATVKVFFNDVEAARYTSVAMDGSTHKYWEVAKVNILTHALTPVLAYTSSVPTTLGASPAREPIAK